MAATTDAVPRRSSGGESQPPLSSLFAKVLVPRAILSRLEQRMQRQVREAVAEQFKQARELELDGNLDAPWRPVGAVGCLKTFKMRGCDPNTAEIVWPTTEMTAAEQVTASRTTVGACYASAAGAAGIPRTRSRPRNATVGDIIVKNAMMQSFRTFGRVQGHFRDIVDAHYAANSVDFFQQQRLLSPYVTDAVVLRTLRASKDSYFGIKWVSEAPPSLLGRKRDYCFLEMIGFTSDALGREVGFVALASVDVPECPEFPSFLKMTRLKLQRTMIVRAAEVTLATSEVFVMGTTDAMDSPIAMNAQLRVFMTVLNDISLAIDSRNLTRQTLIQHRRWVPDATRRACNVCSRSFHALTRRRHHCRLCGEVVCKSCYVLRTVPSAVFVGARKSRKPIEEGEIGATKFCVRCVMGLRAIDKRLDGFHQEISKLMSISNESLIEIEDTTTASLSASRDSSVTYFKRGSMEQRVLNIDELYEDHIKDPQPEDDDGAELHRYPHQSELDYSMSVSRKQRESENLAKHQTKEVMAAGHALGRPSSQSKLVRLSQLSRSSSASRLLAELYERSSVST